jgi:hypothetical protein
MRTIAVPCFGSKEATLGHFFERFKSGVVTEGRDVLFDDETWSMHGFCSCFGCCLIFKPCWAYGFDPHCCPGVAAFDFVPAKAVIHWRNHPGWDENINVAYIPRYIGPGLFKLSGDASHLTLYGFDE